MRRQIILESLNFLEKRPHILKTPIHGGKTHIGDLIESTENIHHPFPYPHAVDLTFATLPHPAFDFIDGLFDAVGRDGSFFERLEDPCAQLFVVEGFSPPVVLDDARQTELRGFVGRKTGLAALTLTTSSNLIAVTKQAGINHPGVIMTAERTVH